MLWLHRSFIFVKYRLGEKNTYAGWDHTTRGRSASEPRDETLVWCGKTWNVTYRTPIMKIYSFPEWIITWIERPAVLVKLIWENKNQLFVGNIALLIVCFLRSVLVDESKLVGEDRDLAGGINAANVEPAIEGWFLLQDICQNWETCWRYESDQVVLPLKRAMHTNARMAIWDEILMREGPRTITSLKRKLKWINNRGFLYLSLCKWSHHDRTCSLSEDRGCEGRHQVHGSWRQEACPSL